MHVEVGRRAIREEERWEIGGLIIAL